MLDYCTSNRVIVKLIDRRVPDSTHGGGRGQEALLGNLPWSDLRGKIEYAINLSTDISRIFKYEREHTDEKIIVYMKYL
ncbi:MAG: hypothetical protein ACLUTU_17090 [Blautia faecis]